MLRIDALPKHALSHREKVRVKASRSLARITVRVQPRASSNEVVGLEADGALKVRVTAPPAEGAANEAVIKLIADAAGVPKSAVTIVRGGAARLKLVEIAGLGEAEFKTRVLRARRRGRTG